MTKKLTGLVEIEAKELERLCGAALGRELLSKAARTHTKSISLTADELKQLSDASHKYGRKTLSEELYYRVRWTLENDKDYLDALLDGEKSSMMDKLIKDGQRYKRP